MMKMITTMIRPKMEYVLPVLFPYKKKKIERIQREATKIAPELEGPSYEEWLKVIHLPAHNKKEKGRVNNKF